jgi:cytochrome d ubiquinol oxidase subunit II
MQNRAVRDSRGWVAMIEPLIIPVDTYLIPSLPTVWFGVVLFTLAMYVVLDGLDFGIGILYATRSSEREREMMLEAFGPIWDANEVWLIAFGTTALAAFPLVYSRLLSDHYLLAIAIVLALLFRGIAPELREQRDDKEWKRRWDRVFVAGSTISPLLLGTLVGSWVFASGTISLPSILTGVGLVALSVTAGASFLEAKTEGTLQEDMKRYATLGTLAYLVGAVILLATVFVLDSAGARETLLSPAPIAIVLLTVVFGVLGIVLGRRDRHRERFAATGVVAVLLIALVAALLYPSVYPLTGHTISEAVVSPLALNLVTVLGLPVLLVVLWYFKYLYGVFSGPVEAGGYGG